MLLTFVYLTSYSHSYTIMIYCAGLLVLINFDWIISNLFEIQLMKSYPEVLAQNDENYLSQESSQLQNDIAYFWVVVLVSNSFITTTLTWIYNALFFCPDFENTFSKLEGEEGSFISSSACPPLVVIIVIFSFLQLAWCLMPFASIPLVSFILRKVEERALGLQSEAEKSKKLDDGNASKKKSDEKTKDASPDTDEESQKPIKEGDESKSSFD